jgi:hypothetical protein
MKMKLDTQLAAMDAGIQLDRLLGCVQRDTVEAIENDDIPLALTFFSELDDKVGELRERLTALQKQIDLLSYDLLPTMLNNHNVKTITIAGIGRASVNDRWSARMINRKRGYEWLRATGNEGLIIETVNAGTLGRFAKESMMEGKPLPADIFHVSAAPYISISAG